VRVRDLVIIDERKHIGVCGLDATVARPREAWPRLTNVPRRHHSRERLGDAVSLVGGRGVVYNEYLEVGVALQAERLERAAKPGWAVARAEYDRDPRRLREHGGTAARVTGAPRDGETGIG
jgi:hypothetical protein